MSEAPPSLNESLLDERLAALERARNWSPRLVSKLESCLRFGDDEDLFRINPLRFANERRQDEAETVDLFLTATKVGLLDMHWQLLCPACANVVNSFRDLRGIGDHYRCELCHVGFEAALDDYVEVSFTVSPDIRDIRFHHPDSLPIEDFYYRFEHTRDARAGPDGPLFRDLLSQFVVILSYLEPGETRSFEFDCKPGYISGCDRLTGAELFYTVEGESTDTPQAVSITLEHGQFTTDRESLRPGPVRVTARNADNIRGSIFALQSPEDYSGEVLTFPPFLTGKQLLTTQTFHELFSEQTIQHDIGLTVRDIALLFTDLKGSTSLYERIGDLNAFNLVQRHFQVLTEVVQRHRGAIVKTMGDAVMASFSRPVDAVAAAREMLDTIERFDSDRGGRDVILKIGVHCGFAIAVTLNDRLDFFGQTVNLAARIQALADADEIYLSDDVMQAPGVAALLESQSIDTKNAALRGILGEVRVHRLRT